MATLAANDGAATIYNGVSPIFTSTLGSPPARVPSSRDAQASLESSWGAPTKAGWASEVRSRESTTIIIWLFRASSSGSNHFGHFLPNTSKPSNVSPPSALSRSLAHPCGESGSKARHISLPLLGRVTSDWVQPVHKVL